MKVLVLSQAYPSLTKPYAQAFIHSRNLYYIKFGYDVHVGCFSCNQEYQFEGITIYPESKLPAITTFDVVISHAPNLRNHFRFLLKNFFGFKKIIFIFHGYEVMRVANYVDPFFQFMKPPFFKRLIHRLYDEVKIPLVSSLIKLFLRFKDIRVVYVSETFRDWVHEELGLNKSLVGAKEAVIYNSVNPVFVEKHYEAASSQLADFIAIRPFDEPKYGVDLYVKLAERYPEFSFHLYGKGNLFNHINKPNNLQIFDKFISQKDLPDLLNQYRFGVMFSRCDSQGVMACEMASYGLPLISSDLPVFHEVFADFANVRLVSNDLNFDLPQLLRELEPAQKPILKYHSDKTISKEVELISSFTKAETRTP